MNEIESIRKEFSETEGLVIFDIGGYDFEDSIKFKQVFPQSEVYSFEPDPNNLERHSQKAKEWRINVIPNALSDSEGWVTFYPSDHFNTKDWKASGSIIKPTLKAGTERESINFPGLFFDMNGYSVETLRLDEFCQSKGINRIDHIHIDVQGAEMKVLSALGDLRPRLIFAETCEYTTYETGITRDEFDSFMKGLGYEILDRTPTDTLYRYEG